MDTNTAVILVVALFAIIAVATFAVYRSRAKVDITSPLGSLKVDASNTPPPATKLVEMEDITSSGGGLYVDEETGGGVSARKVTVKDDVIVTSRKSTPPADPKA